MRPTRTAVRPARFYDERCQKQLGATEKTVVWTGKSEMWKNKSCARHFRLSRSLHARLPKKVLCDWNRDYREPVVYFMSYPACLSSKARPIWQSLTGSTRDVPSWLRHRITGISSRVAVVFGDANQRPEETWGWGTGLLASAGYVGHTDLLRRPT